MRELFSPGINLTSTDSAMTLGWFVILWIGDFDDEVFAKGADDWECTDVLLAPGWCLDIYRLKRPSLYLLREPDCSRYCPKAQDVVGVSNMNEELV